MNPVEIPELDQKSIDVLWRRMDNLERMSGSQSSFGGGGGNGNGGGDVDLAKRVDTLEKSLLETREKVVRIEGMVESIRQHGSTKEDVQKVYTAIEAVGTKVESSNTKIEAMGRTIIQWFIVTGVGLAGLAFAAARYMHS